MDGRGRCQARRCSEVEGRAEAGDWASGRWRFEEDRNTDWLEVDEGDLPVLCTSDGAEKWTDLFVFSRLLFS